MKLSAIDDQVRKRLRAKRIRYTRGRQLLVEALSNVDGPRAASELHAELGGDYPLSSLYRSLTVLSEAGVVAPHHGAKGVTRYELAEWLTGHHHHLVCIDCGKVDDVELETEDETALTAVASSVAGRSGFELRRHMLELDGRCEQCA